MNFNEWQTLWQSAPVAVSTARPVEETIKQVRSDARKFARTIFWRDVREVLAAVVVAGVFANIAWQKQRQEGFSWDCWIAAVIPLGVAAFLVVDRIRMKKARPEEGLPVLVELDKAIAEVAHQRWLLRNVAWWYLLPLAVSAALIMAQPLIYGVIPFGAKLLIGAVTSGALFVVYALIWRLNQKAIRQSLQPRLDALEACRRELTSSP